MVWPVPNLAWAELEPTQGINTAPTLSERIHLFGLAWARSWSSPATGIYSMCSMPGQSQESNTMNKSNPSVNKKMVKHKQIDEANRRIMSKSPVARITL